ncbi:MAG TPA: glucuronate isomerase [Candidatus Limnocylindrales bacterium]
MDDQLFPADPTTRGLAREIYAHAKDLPLLSPHGHVDPAILAEDAAFPDPARLIISPDHYLTRMLLSQGIPPGELGVRRVDGGPVEEDPRKIWRTFTDNWHLFRGTPSRLWLEKELREVFGIQTPMSFEVYDELAERLKDPEFRPRALFKRFNLEVLATTESPCDPLSSHDKLRADGWGDRVVTTFRPDDVVDLDWAGWPDRVARLGEVSGCDTTTFGGYLEALRQRRRFFIAHGATCSDHGHPTARIAHADNAAAIYQRALSGQVTLEEGEVFRAHMLMEFARMSLDDGLVMQLHPGSVRNHNRFLHRTYGRDTGGDIPQATSYTDALKPLLDAYGHDPRLRIVVYTLDEYTYTRELAPLAGGYPSLFLGAPWWFLDSPEALRRWREAVTETAGFYNTAGFVDDTRAYCSIPVRHDVARRVDAGFLARLVAEHRLCLDEALETMADLAYHLPKKVFKL